MIDFACLETVAFDMIRFSVDDASVLSLWDDCFDLMCRLVGLLCFVFFVLTWALLLGDCVCPLTFDVDFETSPLILIYSLALMDVTWWCCASVDLWQWLWADGFGGWYEDWLFDDLSVWRLTDDWLFCDCWLVCSCGTLLIRYYCVDVWMFAHVWWF